MTGEMLPDSGELAGGAALGLAQLSRESGDVAVYERHSADQDGELDRQRQECLAEPGLDRGIFKRDLGLLGRNRGLDKLRREAIFFRQSGVLHEAVQRAEVLAPDPVLAQLVKLEIAYDLGVIGGLFFIETEVFEADTIVQRASRGLRLEVSADLVVDGVNVDFRPLGRGGGRWGCFLDLGFHKYHGTSWSRPVTAGPWIPRGQSPKLHELS